MTEARISLRVDAWPTAEHLAWEQATAAVDLLAAGDHASRWRPATRRHAEESYGCWLAWLHVMLEFDPGEAPAHRLTHGRLAEYILHMQARLAPATVVTRLVGLERAISVLAPEADRSLLRRAINQLHDPYAGVAGKRPRLRGAEELRDFGLEMMAQAEDPDRRILRPNMHHIHFRDGLIIALLAARPLRRRNFAGLILGQHLRQIDGDWWIMIPAGETKTHRPIEVPFPDQLVEHLERYLDIHRSALLRGKHDTATVERHAGPLWISSRTGRALAGHTINLRVGEHTERVFGLPINMHLFRDCVATSIAIRDPKHVHVAAAVLGHSCLATTERYYNLASATEAAADYHQVLDSYRQGD